MYKLNLIILIILLTNIGCKKEDIANANQSSINTAPKVFAGSDITIALQADSIKLEGYATDAENNIESYLWKKISGPVSYRLMNADSLLAKVYDLKLGTYEFELIVTDKAGLSGKDTVSVLIREPINTPPRVSAGKDTIITLPANSVLLHGSASDAENNIESYSWKKISGPASYHLENPNLPVSNVKGLVKGTYEFELTVTDKGGLKNQNSVIICVIDHTQPGTNEVIFQNLQWECPLECSIGIPNFHSFVPVGTPFKVYIKSHSSTVWIEVIHESLSTANDIYMYGTYKNDLYIISYYESLVKWDVKITF